VSIQSILGTGYYASMPFVAQTGSEMYAVWEGPI